MRISSVLIFKRCHRGYTGDFFSFNKSLVQGSLERQKTIAIGLQKRKWKDNGKASVCLFPSLKAVFVSNRVPAHTQRGPYSSDPSLYPRASVQTLSSPSGRHIELRAPVSTQEASQAQGDAPLLQVQGVMASW